MASPRTSVLWKKAPGEYLTTGIGSLPHAHLDSALEIAFRFSVPFLPQLPIRNPREFMLVQAIEGMPGLIPEEGGFAKIDEKKWQIGKDAFIAKTENAFAEGTKSQNAFAAFEPSPEVWSCWNPFLWELRERGIHFAKIQIAGPLTCQWSLQTTEDKPIERHADLSMQVFRVILARAIAMSRKLQSINVVPLFYLDEPGFFAFSRENPKHLVALSELKLFIRSLQKESTLVGLHCCSNTDWKSVLSLPLDVLSIDTHLSLASLLSEREAFENFLEQGGRLSLGGVPTGGHSLKIQAHTPQILCEELCGTLEGLLGTPLAATVLKESLITPACGLALHTVEDVETIVNYTLDLSSRCHTAVAATLRHTISQ